ncbi:class I SAM-dependent methyltransferase [Brachybacterium sp. JHP9]|uniref:Class I SAM-dependent methyltransferase n=1 Tax=Brachybacterium equifaecis TaxID=2910770 RepID=A0ABT0QWB9_9MICO|nr:class I SAM-dependent methyltransferase [Brachybacterium equifaecis]MCL6421931.1 class I SAM-dependent methyltransferase [Brachybacterium equifaecis]
MGTTPTRDSDWQSFNSARARTGGVRPLALKALDALAAGRDGIAGLHAVELGCSAGRETRYLLEEGLSADTQDIDPTVVSELSRLSELGTHTHRTMPIEEWDPLPPADLVLACASLPFVPREAFPLVWSRIREALRPGGILAVDLFGDRDTWASAEGTYLSEEEVRALRTGLEIVELEERDEDGRAFSGPKHWHAFTVIARRSAD